MIDQNTKVLRSGRAVDLNSTNNQVFYTNTAAMLILEKVLKDLCQNASNKGFV